MIRSVGRTFTLVTLVDPCEVDKYYIRDVARTYCRFNRLFNIVDVRNYRAMRNNADVTILDRFALFAAMYYDRIPYNQIIDQFVGTKNLVFLTADLHYWSLFPDLINHALGKSTLTPAMSEYGRLFEMFDHLSIRHLIACYSCPELEQIQRYRPGLITHVINLHFDPAIFRHYKEQKKYDVVVYGSTLSQTYAFRHRVLQLLIGSQQFRVLHLKSEDQLYNEQICGIGLARKINQSWMGLATVTDFSYLVGKYFEIPACRSVVLGDMNDQGAAIFGGRYIHIDETMSDSKIVKIVNGALCDRQRLQKVSSHMYRKMHRNYTLERYERKLFEIAKGIARREVVPYPLTSEF